MMLDEPYEPGYAGDVAKRKPSGRGGWRPGSGRKPSLHDPVSFTGEIERTDMEVLGAIAEQRNVSIASLVRAAVAAYVNRWRRR